jgi:hypothetical protein
VEIVVRENAMPQLALMIQVLTADCTLQFNRIDVGSAWQGCLTESKALYKNRARKTKI